MSNERIYVIVTAVAVLAYTVTLAGMMLLPVAEATREPARNVADRALDELIERWRRAQTGWLARWLHGRRYAGGHRAPRGQRWSWTDGRA